MLLFFAVVIGAFTLLVHRGGSMGAIAWRPRPGVGPRNDVPVIPVAGVRPDQLTDTWGQTRAEGAREHHAIDIMAPRGTPVVAAAP